MASSKVMASRSPPNRDSPRRPSPSPLNIYSDQSRGFGSMNIDDMLRNIYSDSESFSLENSGVLADANRNKTAEEVWRDIGASGGEPALTLEDFLAKAGAVNAEDVRASAPQPPTGAFGMETAMMSPATGVPAVQYAPAACVNDGMTAGGFGVNFANGTVGVSGGGSGRGKRRAAVEELPLDKATQQKQRRMIKNRESAARSRDRKQAYNVELESLVTQLEADNARLLKEEAELNKERYKQLMENLIPVIDSRRPPRVLGRVRSMEW